jgi:nitrite reductase (NADH) small subunit
MRYEVCAAITLKCGEMRTVQVDRRYVLVARAPNGNLYALGDRCPHRGARLSGGVLEETISSAFVGDYYVSDSYHVRCPWHRFQFDVQTGRCAIDPRQSVPTYSVIEEGGMIFIETVRAKLEGRVSGLRGRR